MSAQAPVTKIACPKDALPSCTPNLMPFHIAYSGPAPISTYFRVRPVPAPTYGKDVPPDNVGQASATVAPTLDKAQASGSSQSTLVASSSSANLDSSHSQSSTDIAVADVKMTDGNTATSSAPQRYTAAFRGRTVQGLQVNLPQGYSGLVLRGPAGGGSSFRADDREEIREEPTTRSGRRRRVNAKRSSGVINVDAQDNNIQIDGDGRPEDRASRIGGTEHTGFPDDPDVAVRVLQCSSTFSSFVLWHQDTFVDEGKDEYLRSLTEWTRLAAEIHRIEDVEDDS